MDTACYQYTSQKKVCASQPGFGKQKSFPWHPGVKSSSSTKGNRVSITFFGTGEKAIVNKAGWLSYSEHSLSKVLKSKTSQTPAFQLGLKVLNETLAKLQKDEVVSSSQLGANPKLSKRRFQHLDKNQLQLEGDENDRQLALKMVYDEELGKWKCRDCPWTGPYKHKAKAHSRDCGSRRRLHKKSSKKEFHCSSKECQQTFASKNQLDKHYRYSHFN